MDEQVIPKEKMDITIDLLITSIVEELAEDLDEDADKILEDFLLSRTGEAFYDVETKLWTLGPSYIADMYRKEKGL